MPAIFVSHGAPTLAIDVDAPAHRFLQGLAAVVPDRLRAIVVVSAHWEDDGFAVTGAETPATIHDFHGFPDELYQLTYPAPGDPALAERVAGLVADAGLPARVDAERGLDHGAWVPLMLGWPDHDVPVVQVSLRRGLDSDHHLGLGRALAPLRDEGVLLLGSGGAVHNLRRLDWHGGGRVESWADEFETWLREAVEAPYREDRLRDWLNAPSARLAHPREEHLMPLHVIAGASSVDPAERIHESWQMGTLSLSSWRFGR